MNKLTLRYLKTYRLNYLNTSFTMAEILLSLTIIGVVAAITLPSLTGNINERTWQAQKKALYSRISQAISLMPNLNGYGIGATENETASNAAQAFVTQGLAKVLKINNICDDTHFKDCGIVSAYKDFTGEKKSIPTTLHELNSIFSNADFAGIVYSTNNILAVAFETQNGENLITYYNPTCNYDFIKKIHPAHPDTPVIFHQATMCVNFIYDLNGTKGPNTFGKDMGFITVFKSTDPIVIAPEPTYIFTTNKSIITAYNDCRERNNSRVPTFEEMAAISIGNNIISDVWWTNQKRKDDIRPDDYWVFTARGYMTTVPRSNSYKLLCVKK